LLEEGAAIFRVGDRDCTHAFNLPHSAIIRNLLCRYV
jgi:hypothetical protein